MNKFKTGDRVVKARPYLPRKYCAHGGDKHTVPLGTKGTVSSAYSDGKTLVVKFDNRVTWTVDGSELSFEEIDWRKEVDY